MHRVHKIKLKPNKKQTELLWQTVGAARFAWNWGLEKWEALYKAGDKCSAYTLSAIWTQERPDWAKNTSRKAQVRSFLHLEGAYKAAFKKLRKFPKFKKRGRCRNSFYVTNCEGKLYSNRYLQLPKIGHVKMTEDLRFEDCKIESMSVIEEAGKWYISIQCEVADEFRTDSDSVVGVDVGIKHWAIASDGTVCETPKQLKHYQRLLVRKQRLLSRKAKGSNRRNKARLQVAKVYQKINNIKLDTIHKFTATIAKNHGVVVVEDLNVAGMKKSGLKQVRKGIQDSAMSEIIRQLKYKCNSHIVVDRFYPSSKTCSNCGNVKQDLTLSDRTYHCHSCGFSIDRDLNAALNLRNKGLDILSTEGHSVNARGGI